MAAHNHNPAVGPHQYRLAQAVLSGASTGMPKKVAREIVDSTPSAKRSEWSRNPYYGDLDAETSMVPAWKYYDSKAARDSDARLKEGDGKKVVLGYSFFGFKEGGGKKYRMRLADHRGNPKKRPTDVDGNPVPQNYEMLSIRRNQGDALDVKKGLALANIPSVIVEPPSTTFGESTGNWSVWTPRKTYKRAVKLAEKAYFDRYPERVGNPLPQEILVYGIPKGETERYMEVLLSTQSKTKEDVEKIKAAAAKDGFHSFRVTTFDGQPPDFTKVFGKKRNPSKAFGGSVHQQLVSAATQYDMKEQEKAAKRKHGYHNIYALSQYLGRIEEVEKEIAAGTPVRKALTDGFTGRLLDVLLKAVGDTRSTKEEQRGGYVYSPSRNPRVASEDMYDSFHGEPSDETVEYQSEEHYHSNLAALGELIELKVKLVNGGSTIIGFEESGEETTGNPVTGHKAVKEFFKTFDIDIIFNRSPRVAMEELSRRTGIGHGVESIQPSEFKRKAGAMSIFGLEYVNMGDPYTRTLMHDGKKFFLGNWGDLVEKYGKNEENPKGKFGGSPYRGTFEDLDKSQRETAYRDYKKETGGDDTYNQFVKAVADYIDWDTRTGKPWGTTRSNPFWPFNSFTKTTIYHVGTGEKYKTSGTYKGYTLYKATTGEFLVPALDKDSRFDTLKDAKRFVDAWTKHRKNPRLEGSQGPVHVPETYTVIGAGTETFLPNLASAIDKAKFLSKKFGPSYRFDIYGPRGYAGEVHQLNGKIKLSPSLKTANPGGELDTHAAKELELFIENDADLYRQQYTPINKNLVTKLAKGVYDHNKAVKLFMYLMESGAKKYAKEYSEGKDWHQIFSPATRKHVAEIFAKHFEVEAELGNYDSLLPKKYSGWRKNPRRQRGPFHEAGRVLGKITRGASRPMDDFTGTVGKVGGYLDDQLGRVLNPQRDTGPTFLTSNEDGTQLYIIGGDQSLDLPALGISGPESTKELVTIGSVTNIVYHAHKIFDGKREEYDYTHKFSEDSHGPLPVLLYDRINRQLKLSGGMYKIERPLVGTSAGIED